MATMSTNTTLTYSPQVSQNENVGCVMLRDLVYHKDLESMVQFNFLVDVKFLLMHVYDANIPITIIHGQKDPPRFNKKRSNIELYSPEIRDRYGTHHTKAMLLFFRDPDTGIKTVQMIVMTANLIQQDWEDMTQGVYRTPRCPLKSTSKNSIRGTLIGSEYGSPFEHELVKYLKAYQLRSVFNIVIQLKLYDWSSCKAILIGSVPGRHKDSFKSWGIERLATVLRHHVDLPEPCRSSSQLVLQCSSLASSPQKWFNSLCQSMSESMENSRVRAPEICVVYPTVDTATKSFTGRYISGDFLRFEEKSYEKNHVWFDSYLYDWKSRDAGRQHIMPHIKTYTRVYQDKDGKPSVAWHLLTSSNLSRAAWGEYQLNETQLYIKSFELGVFFCPSLWEDDDISTEVVLRPTTNSKTNTETRKVVKVRLPYDLPLIRHPKPRQCFTRIE